MVVGVLRAELAILEAVTLKDKRRVIKSVKDRIISRHKVSVAEVDRLDQRQGAVLAVAMVANDSRFVQSCLDKIVDELRMARSATLVDYRVNVLTGQWD
ncbi:MAG TPA: DUF503 domain-containing protein [Phycisphaerae bacterium]|nr:DUF503 domain-containing protein [Phycisphaerae bacterium]